LTHDPGFARLGDKSLLHDDPKHHLLEPVNRRPERGISGEKEIIRVSGVGGPGVASESGETAIQAKRGQIRQ
jgi:hypothetical protein